LARGDGRDFELSFDVPRGDFFRVHVDDRLVPGFPTFTVSLDDFNGEVGARTDGLLVGNIAGDESLEIVATAIGYGPIHAWSRDGSVVPGWPNWDVVMAAQLSLGEFDGDPVHREIGGMHFFLGQRLYRGDGTQLPGWPQPNTDFKSGYGPATIDLDHDGIDELVTYPLRRADGTRYDSLVDTPVTGDNADFPGFAAVADVDLDGEADFIVPSQQMLRVSNSRGLLPGFPVELVPRYPEPILPPEPVVGDVDGDGSPDIVLVLDYWDGHAGTNSIRIFSGRGVLQREWTVPGGGGLANPALADLDADGVPEIIAQNADFVYAWNGAGETLAGWPVSLHRAWNAQAQPIVGDLDGDGAPEIVIVRSESIGRRGALHVYRPDATEIEGFPKPLASFTSSITPAIADLDLDGRNELIVSKAPFTGLHDSVFVYDLAGSGRTGPIEWGQFMGGASRHGFYATGKNLVDDAFVAVGTHGAGNVASMDGRVTCPSDCGERYAKGTPVTFTASAAPGAAFLGWLGACRGQNGDRCSVTIDAYTVVAADFDNALTVSMGGVGRGTVVSSPAGLECDTDCTRRFPARTLVTLSATADEVSEFAGWQGACAGAQRTCSVLVEDAVNVTATFDGPPRLTVARSGRGRGRVTSSINGIDCGEQCWADFIQGQRVMLTATADDDSYTDSWSGECAGSAESCSVHMIDTKTITVSFARKSVLRVVRAGSGGGRVTSVTGISCGTVCSEFVRPGDRVTLQAYPTAGSTFAGWSNSCVENPCTFAVMSDTEVRASFDVAPDPDGGSDGGGGGGGRLRLSDLALVLMLAMAVRRRRVRQ
jgi:hypothetical protein